ncbi:MAG: zinc ribbon domain-containing protein [Dehalococcoidia bacterium]
MIEQLQQLYEVQKLDTQIGQLQRELDGLDDGSEARRQLQECEGGLSGEQEKLTALETDLQDAELKLKSTEDERKQYRDKLYSGSIINPKELQDVQDKIASLTNLKGDLEERGLILMDEVETQSGVVTRLSKEADGVRAMTRQIEKRFQEETDRLTAIIEDLRGRRASAAAPIDDGLLDKYEKICRTHASLGVVRVDSDICDGCRTQFTPAKLKKLQNPALDNPLLCDSCNRILYQPRAGGPDENEPEAAETDADETDPEGAEDGAARDDGARDD